MALQNRPEKLSELLPMSVSHLKKLFPPPSDPRETGTEAEWTAAEERVGFAFPTDYKEFIQTYGTCVLADSIYVMNALTQLDDALDWLRINKSVYDDDRLVQECFPYGFHPEIPGIFPCAWNCNASHFVFWLTAGAPDEWPIVAVNVRGDFDYEKYDCNLTSFLYRLFTKQIDYPLVPESELDGRDFRSYTTKRYPKGGKST